MRACLLFLLLGGYLFGAPVVWTPPKDLTDPNVSDSSIPKIGSDKAGNAITVFLSATASVFEIHGARFNATTSMWGPTSILAPGGAGGTGNPDSAVSDFGRSAAVWEFNTQQQPDVVVQGAPLEKDSTTWETSQTLSGAVVEAATPDVGVDKCGNAIAIWVERDDLATIGSVRAARLAQNSTTWVSTQNVSNNSSLDPTFNALPQIAVNKCGEAVAVWISDDGMGFVIRGARLAPGSNTWQETTNFASSVDVDFTQVPSVAIDEFGNAVVVFTTSTNLIHAARLPPESLTWILSNNGNPISDGGTEQNPRVALDCIGNAVAVWGDATAQAIQGARLLPDSDTWTQFPNNVSAGAAQANPGLAMDDLGNAIAIWGSANLQDIEAAILPALQNTWEQTNDLRNGALSAINPEVSVNSCGTVAAAVWETRETPPPDAAFIQAATTTNPFPPLAPAGIQGMQEKNCFSTQKECFNRIFWLPSPSPNIDFYRILRDNIQIATVSAQKNTVFVEHNVRKGFSFTYSVIAVDTTGKESPPLSVTIP